MATSRKKRLPNGLGALCIVQQVLAEAVTPLSNTQIMTRGRLSGVDTGKALWRLRTTGRVLCSERADGRGLLYQLPPAPVQATRAISAPLSERLIEHTDQVEIPRRLRFLDELLSRPAFQGNAILSAIAADYRAVQRLGWRRDEEGVR